MSNKFISSSLANSQHSLVFSFDLDQNTKEYSLGISPHNKKLPYNELQIFKGKFLWYNPTLINFKQIDDSINPTSYTYQNGYYYVWNTQNKLLGNDIIILQDVIPSQKEELFITFNSNVFTFYHKSDLEKPISNSAVNLNYTCYINTNNYSSIDEAIFNKDQYYYRTQFQVIPQLASDEDYDAIIVSHNTNETVLLASDFIIKVDPTKHNISSIVAKHNGNVQSTDYIKFAEYDRARFVISDYGRMISHSIHKKNSDAMYQQVRVTVFDGDKFNSPIIQNDNYKYVYVNFSVNDKNSISNLTANF